MNTNEINISPSYDYYIILFMIIVCGLLLFSLGLNGKQIYKRLKNKLKQNINFIDDEDIFDLNNIEDEFRYKKLTDI